jgi:hypothetical protein
MLLRRIELAPFGHGFHLLQPALPLGLLFEWQEGYSVFTISASMMDAVRQYIAAQEKHHRQRTFEQELRELLEKHQVQYDPKYLL